MSNTNRSRTLARARFMFAVAGLLAGAAGAQTGPSSSGAGSSGSTGSTAPGSNAPGANAPGNAPSPSPSAAPSTSVDSVFAAGPNPYYIGASEALTHDSNVSRTAGGRSDNYSSTSVFGGFDQPISRQRVYGRASLSANRYQDEKELDNNSYNLGAGLAWATVFDLAGGIDVSANRSLASPVNADGTQAQSRNVGETKGVSGSVNWGGAGRLQLALSGGYTRNDYSNSAFASSETRQDYESLAAYYRPGGALRVGLAARLNHTDTPNAFIDASTGEVHDNRVNGKNIDLLLDYELSGLLSADGRVSYSRQRSSDIASSDFSGFTGSFGINYRATGRTSFRLDAARDAGYDNGLTNGVPATVVVTAPNTAPVSSYYNNNRVTNSANLTAAYSVTAKISANAGLHYSRATLVTTGIVLTTGQSAPDTIDTLKSASLGAQYAITRNVGLSCSYSHESRNVSGGIAYSYSDNTIGCSAQITLQ